MTTRQVRAHCELGADSESMLERAMHQQGLTARAHDRILKVARTIADLEAAENLTVAHLAGRPSNIALWIVVTGLSCPELNWA